MKLSWDDAKRQTTLAERGLDMADASQIFNERHVTFLDDRFDYGETRSDFWIFRRKIMCGGLD